MLIRAWMVLVAAAALCSTAAALQPDEVVVVVNGSSNESVALGRFYCDLRGVPEENLVELDLPTGDGISAPDYDNRLAGPLRQALVDRKLLDRVRCLLIVRGVPFRLDVRPPPPARQRLLEWYDACLKTSQKRLLEDLELMRLIGTHFRESVPAQADLTQRDNFFQVIPALPEQLSGIHPGKYSKVFFKLATERHNLSRELAGSKRLFVMQQILSLYYDAFGLKGMKQILPAGGPKGMPTKEEVEKNIVDLARELEALAPEVAKGGQAMRDFQSKLLAHGGAYGLYTFINPKMAVARIGSKAAVDSELALLMWSEYPHEAFVDNPLHWRRAGERAEAERTRGRVLMVARIDGASTRDVVNRIKDAVATEQKGLQGILYVDGGGDPFRGKSRGSEAAGKRAREYNSYLGRLARMVKAQTDFPVEYDSATAVYPDGSCPDAALYVGWYSLQSYIPAFTWVPGAVGYHVASYEAVHLRDPKTHEWVPRMIADGVSATIGAANEPFLTAFPLPHEFFPLVLSGKLTVCEAYWRTTPYVSWRMMFFGDPLYNPFAKDPHPMELEEGLMPPSEGDDVGR